jgi:hypothetical protein
MLEYKVAFRIFEVERVFEAAATLGLICRVEKTMMMGRKGNAAASIAEGGPPSTIVFTDEDLINARSGVADGIELLEGVLGWQDAAYAAGKSLHVLRRLAAKIDRHPDTVFPVGDQLLSWLETWKATNVDMLMAEAEWRDWERIVEGM